MKTNDEIINALEEITEADLNIIAFTYYPYKQRSSGIIINDVDIKKQYNAFKKGWMMCLKQLNDIKNETE